GAMKRPPRPASAALGATDLGPDTVAFGVMFERRTDPRASSNVALSANLSREGPMARSQVDRPTRAGIPCAAVATGCANYSSEHMTSGDSRLPGEASPDRRESREVATPS